MVPCQLSPFPEPPPPFWGALLTPPPPPEVKTRHALLQAQGRAEEQGKGTGAGAGSGVHQPHSQPLPHALPLPPAPVRQTHRRSPAPGRGGGGGEAQAQAQAQAQGVRGAWHSRRMTCTEGRRIPAGGGGGVGLGPKSVAVKKNGPNSVAYRQGTLAREGAQSVNQLVSHEVIQKPLPPPPPPRGAYWPLATYPCRFPEPSPSGGSRVVQSL